MGNGDWKQGTGNYIVYFHEQREYLYPDVAGILYALVRLLTLYFVSVLQIFCQYLRHSYLSTYFLSRTVHLYKILVELYFIERIFSFRLWSILNLSLLIPFLIIFQEDVIPLFWRNVSITYRPKVEKIN